MKKIFIASLGTETNSFSPFVTGYRNFEETYLTRNGDHGDDPFIFAVPLITWRRQAVERGWAVMESLCTFAMPAGITLRSVYESYRDEILADLKAALPVDMVLLSLHGAMIAEGYDDCEGDLIAAVRAIVGPEVKIGVELDLHCHLTQKMIDQATAIVLFKEYPHTDTAERAEELFEIIAATADQKVQPHMTLHDCGMIGVYHTTTEPMRSFVSQIKQLEGQDDVLSISVAHGFPWGDVPDMGTRLLVITDNQPQAGITLAETLGQQLFNMRDQLQPNYQSIDEALTQAVAITGPVVLADVSDNAGGGAPSDSTFILRAMLERGIERAAVGCIWDPVAVSLAVEAGEGTQFDLRLGGKSGPMSGDPLDLRVTVTKILHNALQPFGQSFSRLGDAVALRVNSFLDNSKEGQAKHIDSADIDLVVNSLRSQTFHPQAFTQLGLDLEQKQIIVVKSMQHFYAGFAPIANKILYVAAPGAIVPNFSQLPYRHINPRKWPLS